MAIHFVADLHFDGNSARHALPHGFADSRERTRRICEVWRARVAADDTVWILGNVGNAVHLAGLPGTKHLVRGAFDPPMWNCLATRRYASVCDSRLLDTPRGSVYLSSNPAGAPDDMRVLHGHAPGWSVANHVCVTVDATGWGPVSLELIARRASALRRAA
ncbi:MAG TPA: phosphoesterase [Novosphingobium sp.]|nr:phosphoesterase [Novosphingobium sp.]